MLKRILHWLIVVLVPVVLVLGAVRLLLTPVFIQIEYRMPNFPEDSYGFSQEERLHWAEIARQYLLNRAGIEFLGDLTFEDSSPLYNQRELRHMLDVKIVVNAAMGVLYASLALIVIAGVWARRTDWWESYRLALSRGGWVTVGLLVFLIVAIALSFNTVFVAFHQVFFEGDTWIFRYSDTLIRLFPVRFWRDAFVTVGVLALSGGLALGYFFGRPPKR
jgi:integral membrane protein (TIGR01906 family)